MSNDGGNTLTGATFIQRLPESADLRTTHGVAAVNRCTFTAATHIRLIVVAYRRNLIR